MAQSGAFDPGPIQRVNLVIRVNGVERPHFSASWGGDTPGGLPDQVVSTGTGMRSRTGRIRWLSDPLTSEPPHPLRRENGWPPLAGSEVEIDAEVDGVTFRRFTGVLGATTGSLTDDTLESEIHDLAAAMLSPTISIPPRLVTGGGQSYRVVREALEEIGLGLLPRPEGEQRTILYNLPQGGTQSLIGGPVVVGSATRSEDPYGMEVWDDLQTPALDLVRDSQGVIAMGRGATNKTSELTLDMEGAGAVKLSLNAATKLLTLTVGGTTVATATYVGEGVPILAFAFAFDVVRIWTSRTSWHTAIAAMPESAKVLRAHGKGLAGVTVRYSTTLALGYDMAEEMVEWPAGMRRTLLTTDAARATRGFENVPAQNVIDSWAEATLASIWVDEMGHMKIAARDRLVNQSVSRTIRVDERIFGGSWSLGADEVYSSVLVRGKQALIQGSPSGNYRVTIYQEMTARVVTEPEDFERFIEAPAEIDWGPVDLIPSRYTSNASVTGTQPEYGTWIHAVVPYDAGGGKLDRWAWDNVPVPSVYNAQFERLGQRTLKVSEQVVPGVGIADGVFLKSPERKEYQLETWIWSPYRDLPSPIIRAQWTATWADFTAKSSLGPAHAPAYEHNVDWWLTPSDAQKVANALALETSHPRVTFSSVTTLWDPRRQIGDIEDWVGVDAEGEEVWRARVLISGYTEGWEEGVPSQSVDAGVISLTDPRAGKTYLDLAAAYEDYADLASGGTTYQQAYNALPDSH